jgi:hypothetical protein
MSWKQERDAFIAQTMAFVQSVAVSKPEAPRATQNATEPAAERPPSGPIPAGPAAKPEVRTAPAAAPSRVKAFAAPIEPARSAEPEPVEPAPGALTPMAIASTDIRTEIQARVASFRAHQERFNRERAEYFSATLARLRASIDDLPPPRGQLTPSQGPLGALKKGT